MNTDDIEKILRQAPSPAPPPGLRDRLVNAGMATVSAQAVSKPGAQPATIGPSVRTTGLLQWVRRWWPALVPVGGTLVCFGIIAAQQAQIQELRRAANAVPAQPEVTASEGDSTEAAETMQAAPGANGSENQAEVTRLRALVAKFTDEVAMLEARLQKQSSSAALAPGQDFLTTEELAPLENARAKSLQLICVNNLKQFGLAARIWAQDNADMTPPSVLSISNELSSPKLLVCPADTGRQAATDWTSFSMAHCSYEYLGQSVPDDDPSRVLARCPIHNNVCLFDGSVQMATPERLIHRDGKMYLDQTRPSQESGLAPANAGTPQPARNLEAEESFRKRYGLPPQQPTPDPK